MKLRSGPLSSNPVHNAATAPRVLETRERQASAPRRCALIPGAMATIALCLLFVHRPSLARVTSRYRPGRRR